MNRVSSLIASTLCISAAAPIAIAAPHSLFQKPIERSASSVDKREVVHPTAVGIVRAASRIRVPRNVCFWDGLDWDELNPAEKSAWARLGWSRSSWDSDDQKNKPPSYNRDWDELSSGELQAAQMLGYTQRSWDGDACPKQSDSQDSDDDFNYDD
jgi:hypothetical protein